MGQRSERGEPPTACRRRFSLGCVLTAIVPQETEPLGIHEHTSKGYCVASGTFYTAIPHKSGALRFHDSRGRMTEDMKRLQVL